MREAGETDDGKKTIRVNVKKSKEYAKKHDNWATKGGSVANSIEHEIIHAKDNSKTEKQVRKETPLALAKMSKREKNNLYKLVP